MKLDKDQPQAVWNYVLTDHLGRPRLVIDEQQKMKWRFAATSFGGTGQAINTVAGQHPFEMPIRFKGQYADAETQLYYNGWRYYVGACGSMVSAICTPLADYQKLKTNETQSSGKRLDSNDPKVKIPQADLTILYDTDDVNQAVQIQKYLDWIKANYGTSLTTTYKQ